MAALKTTQTDSSVEKFINAVADEQKRKDAFAIVEMIRQATKMEPKMWGTSIIGFGSYHYKYDSGHEGDMCLVGFSPRKSSHSLYLPGGQNAYGEELKQLGKHKTGKGCLYINKLADVDQKVLKSIFKKAALLAKQKS
jgi:hypothetical protein